MLIEPGVYREQVDPPISGLDVAPITYRATGDGVILRGTADLSNPTAWLPTTTTAWSIAYTPSSPPTQVFFDGARLSRAAAALDTFSGSFFYDLPARVLYVDAGGVNPAEGHKIEAGAKTYGFNLAGRNDIVIEGFEIEGQNHTGINMTGSTRVVVRGTAIRLTGVYGVLCDSSTGPVSIEQADISFAGSVGIRLVATTGATLTRNIVHHNASHGIELQASSANQILENDSYSNLKPAIRSAAGIDLNTGSNDNLLRSNSVHQNDDSGLQLRSGSSRNVIVRNASWGNGDHGFDSNEAPDNRFISNTAVDNVVDGLSIEGGSTGTFLADNITVNNGAATHSFDLYVDTLSETGLSFDYDLVWNRAGGSIAKVAGIQYTSLADLRTRTGQEIHGLQVDPILRNAAAGDLRLAAGSPAIDSADASPVGFSPQDHDGRLPVDLLTVADLGAGDPPFTDRGAFEYDAPPSAVLNVLPSAAPAPLSVLADASLSSDPDSTPIQSFTFDFGDGTVVGPQPERQATHSYPVPGRFTLSVRIVDAAGLEAAASSSVVATDAASEVRNLRFLDANTLIWDALQDAIAYSLYRGSIEALVDTNGDGTADMYGSCLDGGLMSPGFTDAENPPAGRGLFYLVAGRFASGEGTIGFASTGAPRPNIQPCP